MWDGHTALEHKVVKEPVTCNGFSFCLTFAHLPDSQKFFVFHIASNEPLSETLQKWLALMGLRKFNACPHFGQRPCFWKAEVVSSDDPWKRHSQAGVVHRAFDQLCQNFPKALSELRKASEVLAEIGLSPKREG